LAPDIGRLAYRVWCGKVRGNRRRALRNDEMVAASQTRLQRLSLTSIVDPDKVLPLLLRKFAIVEMNKVRMGR
jgi:hypothetical protein